MIISDGINYGKLQSIIIGELKKAGLKHRLKKIILKSGKDIKAVFGAPLAKVPSCNVICCGSNLSVPIVVSEMATLLRSNAHIEGLFRKAGSQSRQKDIKRLLDAGGCVSEGHHPIDVASVLKMYLRCLPEPLVSAEVQDLLLRCRLTAGEDALKPILHTLLLLPVLHVHLLHYIMEFLNFIASKHKDNLMDSSNLAIVMAPSIMPLPAASSAHRLEHHVALVKMFIENSKHIGYLTEDLMSQLDNDSDLHLARRKKRRSGSLSRMFNGLRKMVSGSVNTPATVCENGKTPVLSKSATKRKLESYEGLSAKTKKEIKNNLQQKDFPFTPIKMGLAERKRLRLSFMDARSTPTLNSDLSSHKNSETSISSEDLLTSSGHLFSGHDTIDLSPETNQVDKDYVKISKQEYEEIKSRVSAIENRLSREFTDVAPRMEPLLQVQNVYKQTLEDVAMLNCPTSDHLARRLSKELKIRPNEETKIIRSPSARKIGSIRRRSKENVKITRHKSLNVPSQSQMNADKDRFYPYVGLFRRERTSTTKPQVDLRKRKPSLNRWDSSTSENSMNVSDASQKYSLRKRVSLGVDYNLDKTINRPHQRRSTVHSFNDTVSENSINITLDSSGKLNNSSSHLQHYKGLYKGDDNKLRLKSPSQQKWRNAAAFFMDKTGEVDNSNATGRPSVNKLRRQNAGAVLAKAKMFESSSDKSSEIKDKPTQSGFARKPRLNGQNQTKIQKAVAHVRPSKLRESTNEDRAPSIPVRLNRNAVVAPTVPVKSFRQSVTKEDSLQHKKKTPPSKKLPSPQTNGALKTAMTPALKKPLYAPKNLRTPVTMNEVKKINTPLKAIHISPRRRSPRHKLQRAIN